MKKRYSLEEQIAALSVLEEHGGDVATAATSTGIPAEVLRRWYKQQADLQREYQQQQQAQAALLMTQVQRQLAEKSLQIVTALDEDRIAKAPLNQLATALGILIDRYLKLTDDVPQDTEQVIRFEFQTPEGVISATPPWANHDTRTSSAVQGGGVRTALWQDDAGKTPADRKSPLRRAANVVARADVSDGEPSMAGLEDDDEERLWYDG
jgi:transposase-like protein